MDRDYTTDAEQELLDDISSLNGINSQFPFSTNYQNLGVTDPANGSPFFNNYQNNNSLLYGSLYNSSIPNAFARVRNYDATAAGVNSGNGFFGISNQMDGIGGSSAGLASFKSALENAVSAIDLSAVGSGTSDVINSLKNSNDIANGTIFGDSYEYASNVFELGFEEEAGRSYAYYEEALDRVFDVDENGVVTYDMDEVEAILSKDADDITEAEYYAVSMAFTYMDEDDMETTICLLMDDGEDVNLPWYDNWNLLNGGPDDYSVWHLDEDKYAGFCNGMNAVSNDNLMMINIYDAQCEITGDMTYRNLADNEENRRMTIVQRNALVQSLGNVSSFRAEYGEDSPTISISYAEDGSLSFDYKDHEKVDVDRTIDGGVMSVTVNYSVGSRNITVGACSTGAGHDYTNTENVSIQLHSNFADGFTSEGYEAGIGAFCLRYLIPLATDESHAYVSNSVGNSFEAIKDYVPYADVLLTTGYNMVNDYQNGVENATFLEGVDISLDQGNVYDTFDCCVCDVSYDLSGTEGYSVETSAVYVEGGRNTNVRLYLYNEATDSNVNVDYLVNNPGELATDITNNVSEDNGISIRDIGSASYSNLDEIMGGN